MPLLDDLWPFFQLEITTPSLRLRYLDDATTAEVLQKASEVGVHDEGTMPFSVPWTRPPSPLQQQLGLQYFWKLRYELKPSSWTLPFGVWSEGQVVGIQEISAASFAVRRTVSTGSWLIRSAQGRGLGKEMRAAILTFAFTGLGAGQAETVAYDDNAASIGVTQSLGCRDNGWAIEDREGQPVRDRRFILTRDDWILRGRSDIHLAGLDACRGLLSADA